MLNNDTVADEEWARTLVEAAASAPPECGMLQSLLLFQDRPDTINSTGIELAYSGGGRDRDGGAPRDSRTEPSDVFCPTAGAAAYRRTMLDAIRLPEGYFDRDHFMYYEDLDLGWRARLAGWTARYVPASVVYHKWHGSSDRHGRSWLVVVSHTNRLRTLLKNASPWFIVRSWPRSALEVGMLVWHGRLRGLSALARAVEQSLVRRSDITKLAKLDRRAVERAWTAKPT
jgi:GT2 family glycosyltransferase